MAGHSKWHNIKRKKGVNDAKRSQAFTKIGRLITVSARQGGGDPNANPALRLAIEKAKQAQMPKDNIEKAIRRGAGGSEGSSYEEVVYEGYGPAGIAFVVKALTDNKNRTVAEIKSIFSKGGGALGAPGSTAYVFNSQNKEPVFKVKLDTEPAIEKVLALESELEEHEDVQEVYSNYSL